MLAWTRRLKSYCVPTSLPRSGLKVGRSTFDDDINEWHGGDNSIGESGGATTAPRMPDLRVGNQLSEGLISNSAFEMILRLPSKEIQSVSVRLCQSASASVPHPLPSP